MVSSSPEVGIALQMAYDGTGGIRSGVLRSVHVLQLQPLRDWRHFPVTTGVGLVAALVSVWWWWGNGDVERLMMSSQAWSSEPWRLVSSIFPHVNFVHLLFNLFWLWYFGCALERHFGSVSMIGIVLLLGVGSGVAEYALLDGGVGLSGVGYGLFAMAAVLGRNDPRFAGLVDRRLVEFFVFWFFLCIGLTIAGLMTVANAAHGWGAVLGGLLGWMATARSPNARLARAVVLAAVLAATIAGGSVARPWINFGSTRGAELARSALDALKDGENRRAVELYHRAIAAGAGSAGQWYNLGVAHHRLGELDQAVVAFRKAYELAPSDEQIRNGLAVGLTAQAEQARQLGQWERAAEVLRQAAEIQTPDSAP